MKKICTLLVLAFVTLNAFAQKPAQGTCGFTFGLRGLQNIGVDAGTSGTNSTLLFRYYFSEGMAGRLGVNFNSSKNTVEDSTSKTTTSNSGWGISLGVQKSLGDNEKIEPYVGIDLSLNGGKNGKVESSSTFTGGSSSMEVDPGSTFTFGLTPLIGFNWFIMDGLAVGAEFGWGLGISSTGEGTTTSTTTIGTTTVSTTSKTAKSNSTSIGGNSTGMITASVFFGGK